MAAASSAHSANSSTVVSCQKRSCDAEALCVFSNASITRHGILIVHTTNVRAS